MTYIRTADLDKYFLKRDEIANLGAIGSTLMKSFPDLRPELTEKSAEPIVGEREHEKSDYSIF